SPPATVSAPKAQVETVAMTTPPSTAAMTPPSTAKGSTFRVLSVDIGSEIGADRKITKPATTFAPNDVVFAVVSSDGSGPTVALKARWTAPDGKVIDDTTQWLEPAGSATTLFHVNNSGGLQIGHYEVAFTADGTAVGLKEFTVK